MVSKYALKLLAGVAATAIAGTAMANTALDAVGTGDLFLNIEDTTNSTSYLYDTGISQAAFNSNGNYQIGLAGDSALTGFLNGSDTFDFSVISATKVGSGPSQVATLDVTGNSDVTPVNTSNANNNQAQSAINLFLGTANQVSTTSTTSVVLPKGSDWGQGGTEGVVSNKIYAVSQPAPFYGDAGALNSSLSFYDITGTNATQLAGNWTFSTTGDVLSYNGSPVPLPTPVLLLLSGLGLMGAVSRRAKSAA